MSPPSRRPRAPRAASESGASAVQRQITVEEYFQLRERPELIFGLVRRLPPLSLQYYRTLAALMASLVEHIKGLSSHYVCALPDVVLDAKKALVLHPAAAVILEDRLSLVRERICGAPNLAIEIISRSSARRTRLAHLRWYRAYGSQEFWLLDTRAHKIEVVDLTAGVSSVPHVYAEGSNFRSRVLPGFSPDIANLGL